MSKIAISAFFAGVVCKMYDDLVDNPTLQKYKTEFLLELLKGFHYILTAFVSINDPCSFVFMYLGCVLYMCSEKESFNNPYEHSVLYSFLILFALIDYNCFRLSKLHELFAMFSIIIISSFYEPNITTQEYSLLKLIIRINIVLGLLTIIYLNWCVLWNNYLMYFLGYFFISVIIQCYSLLHKKEKKKNKKKKENNKRKNPKKSIHTRINKYISNHTNTIIKSIYPPIILKWMHKLDNIQEFKYY